MWVRVPPCQPNSFGSNSTEPEIRCAGVAQLVEHLVANEKVREFETHHPLQSFAGVAQFGSSAVFVKRRSQVRCLSSAPEVRSGSERKVI